MKLINISQGGGFISFPLFFVKSDDMRKEKKDRMPVRKTASGEKEIEKFSMVSWTGDGIVHKGVVTDIDEVSGTKYLKVMTIFGKIRRVKMSKVKAIYTAW